MKMFKKIKNYFSFAEPHKSREEKRKEILLCIISGIAMGIAFPPLPFYFLLFIGLIPYFYVIQRRDGLAEINRATYLMGFFFTVITLYWVGSWTEEADPFLMLSGGVLLFFYPIFLMVPSTLYYLFRKYLSSKYALFVFPLFWLFYEYLLSMSDLRFAWLVLGHGMAKAGTFIQVADIIGAYGISLLLVTCNVLFYKSFVRDKKGPGRKNIFAFIAVGIIAVTVIYGLIKISSYIEPEQKIKVGVIQPNFNPWKKWDAGNLDEKIDQYLELSIKAVNEGAQILVWPESALPVYLRALYTTRVVRIQKFLDSNKVALVAGMPDATFFYDGDNIPDDAKTSQSGLTYTSYNSILGFTPGEEEIQQYGKMLLVPFGEFTPFAGSLPFLRDILKWSVGISDWNKGKEIKVMNFPAGKLASPTSLPDTVKVGGVICIESVYEEFVAQFVQKGAQIITVVTNDSWYGNSSGPRQHKEIGVLRAVENRRSVVRCANGGISTVIDPVGRTKITTEMFTRDYFVEEAVLQNGLTFFTKYPLVLPYLSVVFSICVFVISLSKKYLMSKSGKNNG